MAPVSDRETDTSSVSDRGGRGRKGGPLSLDDCSCPVCLEIFLEPVTLPCKHTFCKVCFLQSVDKATLCCPMCRKRVSSWTRLNNRSKTLVNEQLWGKIQTTFPLQVQRRLSGQDAVTEDDLGVSVCFPRVSEPGELRQEYQDQITKLTEEKRVLDEEERKASEEYIQRLLAEEEELLQEERRRRDDDERLARTLNHELNSASVSQEHLRPAEVTPAKKKEKVVSGQIEKFLCPLPSRTGSSGCSSASSFMSNKENILLSQVKLQVECPLPKLDYYGPQTLGSRLNDCDRQTETPNLHLTSVGQHLGRSPLRGDRGPSSVKRKSSDLEATEEEVMVTNRGCRSLPSTSSSVTSSAKRKNSELEMTEEVMITNRGCHSLPSTSSPSSSSLEAGGLALRRIGEWESELLSRRQQEEEDRRLALLLQKELDQEERQQVNNRSKGSADAYPLRQNHRGKAKASSTQTPSRAPKTSKTPSSCSSSPSSASSVKSLKSPGSKQVTLTKMFSSSQSS